MKSLFLLSVTCMLFACNSNDKTSTDNKETAPTSSNSTETKKEKTPAAATEADLSGPVIASIDLGNYIFRVHEVLRFEPKPKEIEIIKLDKNSDYYILDCSIESKSDSPLEVGVTSLAAYFKLSDGTTHNYTLGNSGIIAAYNNDYGQKYPQKQYDLLWSGKFPPNGKARAHLYGVKAPKGVTVTGIGFYQKSKTKNKYADFQ